MASNMVYLPLTREQGKKLLKLLDGLEVTFASDTPLWLRGISKRLHESMFPESVR